MGRVQVPAGLVMAVVGPLMILALVALAVVSDDPLPIPSLVSAPSSWPLA
jgi:hypothetical protein